MALSTLLRNSVCMNRALCTQFLRYMARPAPLIKFTTQNSAASAPIFNAVRSIQTSAVNFSSGKGSHTKLWVVEKIVAAVLLPLIPAAIMFPNKILDSILAIAIVSHTFWGFEAIAVDYARPIVVGPAIAKLTIGLVYLVSFATLGGLFYIIQHDIGIGNTIRQLWAVKSKQN